MKSCSYQDPDVLARLPENVSSMIQRGCRIAQLNQPMVGCELRHDLTQPFALAFDALQDDVGRHYAAGLRNGSMVPVLPLSFDGGNAYYAPGSFVARHDD